MNSKQKATKVLDFILEKTKEAKTTYIFLDEISGEYVREYLGGNNFVREYAFAQYNEWFSLQSIFNMSDTVKELKKTCLTASELCRSYAVLAKPETAKAVHISKAMVYECLADFINTLG